MPSYTLTFTLSDTYSTGSNELAWEVRTASGGGGSLLLSGTATSGVQVITGSINDAGLVHGSNTRYLYVIDGAGNILDQSFTVTAALEFDIEPAGSATIDADGGVTVTADIPASGDAAIDAAGTAAIALAPTGDAAIAATGAVIILEIIPVAPAGDAAIDAEGATTIVAVSVIGGEAHVDAEGVITITADVAPAGDAAIDAEGTAQIGLEASGEAAIATEGAATVGPLASGDVGIDAEGAVSTEADIPPAGEPAIGATGATSLEADIPASGEAAIDVTGSAVIELTGFEIQGYRLRADLYNLDGDKLAGLFTILRAEYGEYLDGIGSFSLEVPATDPAATYLSAGAEVHIHREGEGLCFRGVVVGKETLVSPDGTLTVRAFGDSIARQLVWANTLLGREFSNTAMSSVAGTLLSGTGWTANSVDSDTRNLTAQYEGASVWAALLHAAETFGWHLRERNLERTIDIGAFGSDCGLVMQNVEHIEQDMGVLPVVSLRVLEAQDELWNRVIPIGGGEGINKLTLRYSDRVSPYTIESDTGPDGQTYWYIEDSDSITDHGLRVKVLSVDDVVPLSNSDAEIENAANALYDIAAAWLGWHAEPQESYEVEIVGLRHIEDESPAFRVGDTARLVYRGVVSDDDGRRLWKAVDDDLYILGYRRGFETDGTDRWQFTVSTTDQEIPSDADTIARAIEDLWAIQTAKRPYTYREIHGPYVESLNASNNATFPVDFDDNVTYLHQAILKVENRRVKSNVSAAAAGGGQTSSSGGGQTTSAGGGQTSSSDGAHSHSVSSTTSAAGGGQTSSGGTAHSHSVSGQAAQGGGEHTHVIGALNSVETYAQQPYQQQVLFFRNNQTATANWGGFVGRGSNTDSLGTLWSNNAVDHTHTVSGTTSSSESSHTHSVSNHQHSVSGQTAQSGGSHTHTVSNHTHTVSNHTHEIDDHTHALVYGIYEGPVANAPFLNISINGVDRTAALGGPWNGSPELDITQYLVDGNGHVLRQSNEIEFSASQLMDLRVTVKSMVTAHSIVPV